MSSELDALGISWTDETTERAAVATRVAVDAAFAGSSEQKAVQSCARTLEKAEVALERYLGEMEEAQAEEKKSGTPAPPHVEGRRRQAIAKLQGEISTAMAQHKAARDKAARAKELLEMKQINAAVKARQEEDRRRLELEAARAEALAAGDDDDDDAVGGGAAGTRNVFAGQNSTATSVAAARHNLSRVEQIQREAQSTREEQLRRFQSGDRSAFRNANVGSGPGANASAASAARFGGSAAKVAAMHRETSAANRNLVGAKRPTKGTALAGADLRHVVGEATVGVDGTPMTEAAMEYRGGSRVHDSVFRTQVTTKDRRKFAKDRGEDDGDEAQFLARLKKEEDREIERAERRRVKERRRAKKNRLLEKKRQRDEEKAAAAAVAAVANAEAARAAGVDAGLDETGRQRKSKSKKEKKSMETKEEKKQREKDEKKREKELKKAEKEQEKADKKAQRESEKQARKDQKEKEKQAKREAKEARHRASDAEPNASRGRLGEDQPLLAQSAASAASSATPVIGSASALGLQQEQTLLLNANSSNGRTTNNENSAVKISGCPSDGAMTEPLAVSAASSLPPTLAAPTFDGSAAGDGDSAADSDSDSDVMEVTADGSPIVSFKTEPGTSSSSSIPALITAASASGSSSSIVPPSATGSSASIGDAPAAATAPTDNGVKKVRLVPTRKPPVAAAAAPSASTPPPAVAAPPAPSLVKLPSSTGPTGGAAGAAICPPSPLPPGKIVMKKMMMPLRTASQTAGSQTAASASASPVPPAVPRVASTSAVLPPFQVAAPLPPRPRPKPQAKLVGASAASAPGRSTRRRGRHDDDSDSDESSSDDDTTSSDDYDDSSSSDDGARRGKKKNAKKKAAEKAKKGAKGKKGKKGKQQESSSDSSWSSGSSSWDSALDELSDSQEEDEEAANGAGFFSDDGDQRREVDDHLPEEMRPNFPVPILGSICLKKSVWDSLLDYQQVGLHWLCQHHLKQTGGILGDEMGLGKTIQIAAFLAALHQSGELTRPVLIVSPSTVLQQWVNELHKWCTDVRAVIWHSSGSAGQRGKDTVLGSVIETGGIIVTTYQTMALYVESLHEADFQYVILDEGHKICNPEANITIAAKTFTTPHRFILSGSPIQNSLKELWSLFDFVAPGIFGTLAVFTDEFEEPIRQSKNPTASAMQQNTAVQCARLLQRHIAPHLLRRMKKEVNTMLPAKHERVIRCPLTDAQLQEYLNILADPDLQQMFARIGKDKQEIGRLDRNGRNWRGALVSGPGEMRMAGRGITEGVRNRLYAYLTELRAVCNHADLHKLRKEDADEREALGGERAFGTEGNGAVKRKKTMSFRSNKDVFVQGSGKLVVLEKLMEQWHRGGHKVLLFSQTRMMLDILENFVEQKHYSYMRIDGTTPTKTRSILIDKYNADTSIFAALLTTRVGGIGVNLVGADRVVIFDPDWNPVTDEQARERAWRIGQSREVCIYRFITSGTVEEHVLHRQLAKTYVTDKVLADPTLERAFSQHSVTEAFMLGSEYASRVSSTSKEFVASSVTATLAQELDSAWAHAGHGHGAAKADAHKNDDAAQKQQPSKTTPSAPLAASSTRQAMPAQDSEAEAAAAAAAEAAAVKARVAAAVQRAVSSVGPQPPMPTPMAKTVGPAGHAPAAPPAAASHVTRFGDAVASPGSAAVTSSTPRSPQMRAGSHGGGMGSRTPSGGAAELRTPGLRGVMSSQGGHTPKYEPTSPLNQAGTPGRRGSRPARITLPTAAGVHEAPEELVVDIAALTQDSPTERPPPSPRVVASSSAAAAAPTTGAATTSSASAAPTQAASSMPPPQVGFGASPFASNADAVGATPPAASAAAMPPPAVPSASGSDGPRRQLSSLGGHRMSSFVRKDSAGADAAIESQLSDLSQVLEDEAKMDSGSFQGLGANGDDEDDMPRRKASDANKNGLTSVLQDLVDGEELQARPVDPLAFHLASLSAKRHLSNAIKSGQPAPHAAHHGHRHPGQAHASHSQGQQGQPQQQQQASAGAAVRVKRERTR